MTTVDPDTGIKSRDMEPLKTLKDYRMNKNIDTVGPLFGAYLDLADDEKRIFVGDTITESTT